VSSFGDEWQRRTAWKDRAAYRAKSRNGAVAFWLGVAILLALLYGSVFGWALSAIGS
jgi:hypothetical protein